MANLTEILKEVSYKTSRSSGAGGQHVNKVETKVEILFSIQDSKIFSETEKQLLSKRLSNRIDKNGLLRIVCQESRSQLKNKAIAEKKLILLLKENLKVLKVRKATQIPKSVKRKRLQVKRIKAEIKQNRKKVKW